MKGFGAHPDFVRHFEYCWKMMRRGKGVHWGLGERVNIEKFVNSKHPEVSIIPRSHFWNVEDEFGDSICVPGMDRVVLHFSSTDFWIDEEAKGGVFGEILRSEAFYRLGGIVQLGSLVTRDKNREDDQKVHYCMPHFKHTRWAHSRLTAVLAELVLARNGFSREERASFVLTAACHDIATPAGGDSVMRIDRKGLSEEENFASVLQRDGLDQRWREKFDFDLKEASRWVKGEGVFGKVLDVIDKISYTALDCYFIGIYLGPQSKVFQFASRHRLVADVWQTIRIKNREVYFTDPELLYNFLMLRALEHQELLLDPYCRVLDFTLSRKIGALYEAGKISKEWLLTKRDSDLWAFLEGEKSGLESALQTPDRFSWKKFKSPESESEFVKLVGDRIYFQEIIKPFKTGTNWLVELGGKLVPLREVISKRKIRKLEAIAESCSGRFVYYFK